MHAFLATPAARRALLLVAVLLALPAPAAAYHKIIVIDKSGSMNEADKPGGTRKFQQASKLILEEVELDLASGNNSVTLLFFDSRVSGIRRIATVSEARTALRAFRPMGSTNIGDTLAYMLKLLQGAPGERYFVVSLYTDGQEQIDPGDQRVTMSAARKLLIDHFNQLKQRTFVSFYHHQWNSKQNRDFSRVLHGIQQATRGNRKLEMIIEENKDPGKRARFAGVILDLDREQIFVEQPRGKDVLEVELGISYQAMASAHKHKLVFDMTPTMAGQEGLTMRLEPSRLVVDRAAGKLPVKVLIKGLGQLKTYTPYELGIELKLNETENDNLLRKQLEEKSLILRLMPRRLYASFVLAPTPRFSVTQPRDKQVSAALKVGQQHYQELALSWNKSAVGKTLRWSVPAGLTDAVSLVDAQRRPVNARILLGPGLSARFFVAVSLRRSGDLDGALTLAGEGKLEGVSETVAVKVNEQYGTLQVLFPDRTERKVFPGLPVAVPLGIQLKPDRLAVGERYLVKTQVPNGITLEIRDDFDRVVNDRPLTIDGAQLFHLGIRLTLAQGMRADSVETGAIKIIVVPVDKARLRVVGDDGSPATAGFGLPFALAAPQKEFTVRFAGAGSVRLRRGSKRTLGLDVGWTDDASTQPFELLLTPELLGISGGPPSPGLRWSWAGAGSAPRTLKLGGGDARTAPQQLVLEASREGRWTLQLTATGLGRTKVVKLPVETVVGEVNVVLIPAPAALEPGQWQAAGQLRIAPRNPFTAGLGVQVERAQQPGVALRLVDGNGRQLDGEASLKLSGDGAPTELTIEVRCDWAALAAGIGADNWLRLRPVGAGLRLFHDGRESDALTLPLSWGLVRPRLTHQTDGKTSKDIGLGPKPSKQAELVPPKGKKPVMTFVLDRIPDGLRTRAGEESVTLTFEERDTTRVIAAVVFTATGQPTATVAELLSDARLTLKFKDGVRRPWAVEEPVYVAVALATEGPIQIQNASLRFRTALKARLGPLALAGIGLAVLLLLFGVVKLAGGSGGGAATTMAGTLVGPAGEVYSLDGFSVVHFGGSPGGGLQSSSVELPEPLARIVPGKMAPMLEPAAGVEATVGGAPVKGKADLVDGASVTIGAHRLVYKRRSTEARPAEAVDLSAPAAQAAPGADEPGIQLDLGGPATPAAAPEAAPQAPRPEATPQFDAPPPPPPPDDEDGIVL